MGSAEAENISRYLRTKEIQLPPDNKWLLDCINWYKSHLEVRNIYQSLQDYVCIQWLLSDLRDVQHQCLPANCKDDVVELTGKYCVQVNWVRDISQPCYTQLQAMKNANIADSNDTVTAEDNKKQNWEPSPKRVLMIEITDGFTTLKAMEHSPIHKLTEPFIPGFKVVLVGPIECRKGILFLRSNNISLLGGEVDYLSEMYSKENILSRLLNIIPTHSNNDTLARDTNDLVTHSPPPSIPTPPTGNYRAQPSFNDMDQLPDSTSFIDSNRFEDNRDAMMVDDDDDMLCQLPDTMFNDVNNLDSRPNQMSPVLFEEPPERVQSSTIGNIPEEASVTRNRPKLFPSMEDLRLGKESSSYNTKPSTLTNHGRNSKQIRPETSSTSRSSNINKIQSSTPVLKTKPLCGNLDVSFGSKTSLNYSIVPQRPVELRSPNQNLDDSIANHIDDLVDETRDENVYPQFKRVQVKVLSITKLKIRNGEWNCSASVSFDDKTENVTFCNKVLEKLFGTSAPEVEVLRSEMAKNQSLKEKINGILKNGQTKLKLLNCLMVVEYTSGDCTPNIVSIHAD